METHSSRLAVALALVALVVPSAFSGKLFYTSDVEIKLFLIWNEIFLLELHSNV